MKRLEKVLEEAADNIKSLHDIGAKLAPIIRELDNLEAHGDNQLTGFIKSTTKKLDDLKSSILEYR